MPHVLSRLGVGASGESQFGHSGPSPDDPQSLVKCSTAGQMSPRMCSGARYQDNTCMKESEAEFPRTLSQANSGKRARTLRIDASNLFRGNPWGSCYRLSEWSRQSWTCASKRHPVWPTVTKDYTLHNHSRHHLERSLMGHAFARGYVGRTARPPSGRPSPAPCLASIEVLLRLPCCRAPGSGSGFGTHAKQRLTCDNLVNPQQPFAHAAVASPNMAFPALETDLSGLVGRFARPAQLVPNPLLFRLAPDHGASRDLLRRSQTTSLVHQVSPGWSAVPRLGTRTSGQSRLDHVSQGVRWSRSKQQCMKK